MKAFGSVRTYGDCRVVRAGNGRKATIVVHVKNRKRDRKRDRQAKVES